MRVAICLGVVLVASSAGARVVARPHPDEITRQLVHTAWLRCNAELYPELIDASGFAVRVKSKRVSKQSSPVEVDGRTIPGTLRKIVSVEAITAQGAAADFGSAERRSSPVARAMACVSKALTGKTVLLPTQALESIVLAVLPQPPKTQDGQISNAPATAYVQLRASPLLAKCSANRSTTLTLNINADGSVESIASDSNEERAGCWCQLKAKLTFPTADGTTQISMTVKK